MGTSCLDFALLKLTLPKTSEFWGGFAHKASQRLEIRMDPDRKLADTGAPSANHVRAHSHLHEELEVRLDQAERVGYGFDPPKFVLAPTYSWKLLLEM